MSKFERTCERARSRIRKLPLNDQYTQTIVWEGRTFFYDPDYDCFYPITPWEEMSWWDRYGWLLVAAGLTIAVLIIEYVKNGTIQT